MVLTKETVFRFKQFEVSQDKSAMKVSSDGVLLGAWVNVDDAEKILDIGTGTGLIALMAAQKNLEAEIYGVEVDPDSSIQAKENFDNSPWSSRLHVEEGMIQNFALEETKKFDHIISNPPFFSGGTLSDNQPKNIVRHTVKLPHGDLLIAIRRLLADDGKVSIILPLIEAYRFIELIERQRFSLTRKTIMKPRANSQGERILFEFELAGKSKKLEENEIVMYEDGEKIYTDDYKLLTKDFYL